MQIAVAVALFAIVATLSWSALSTGRTLRGHEAQIRQLETLLAEHSEGRSFTVQRECAESAHRFMVSRGLKMDDGYDYENHFNERVNRCFVLVSSYSNTDFRTIDLYDAVEGRRYAMYNGRNACDAIFGPRTCEMNSGSIWFDGNDSRMPADFTVGFGGGGAGDANTQPAFVERVRGFMTQ